MSKGKPRDETRDHKSADTFDGNECLCTFSTIGNINRNAFISTEFLLKKFVTLQSAASDPRNHYVN